MNLHAHGDLRRVLSRISSLGTLSNARKILEHRIVPIAIVAFATGSSALAADITSTWNVASGNWGVATNWNPNTNFPNNGAPALSTTYDAVLGNSGTITL